MVDGSVSALGFVVSAMTVGYVIVRQLRANRAAQLERELWERIDTHHAGNVARYKAALAAATKWRTAPVTIVSVTDIPDGRRSLADDAAAAGEGRRIGSGD